MYCIFPINSFVDGYLGWICVLTIGNSLVVKHGCTGISVTHWLRVLLGWLDHVVVTLLVFLAPSHWFPQNLVYFYWCTVESIIPSMFYLRTTHSATRSWKPGTLNPWSFRVPECWLITIQRSPLLAHRTVSVSQKSPIKDYGMNKSL